MKDQRLKIKDPVLELKGVNSVNSVNSVSVERLLKAREIHSAVKELRSNVSELAEEYLLTVKGEDENGKEIAIDLWGERNESETFYREHGLSGLADALPGKIRLNERIQLQIREAMKQGMDRVLVCVPIEMQESVSLVNYKEELADRPFAGLKKEDQFHESLLDYDLNHGYETTENEKRVRQSAYLLFYSSKPIPNSLNRIRYTALDEYFEKNKCNALTVREYYLLQRFDCEKTGNHDFHKIDDLFDHPVEVLCFATKHSDGSRVRGEWQTNHHSTIRPSTINVHSTGLLLSSMSVAPRPVVVVPLIG